MYIFISIFSLVVPGFTDGQIDGKSYITVSAYDFENPISKKAICLIPHFNSTITPASDVFNTTVSVCLGKMGLTIRYISSLSQRAYP